MWGAHTPPQGESATTRSWTKILTVASPTLYHRAIKLFPCRQIWLGPRHSQLSLLQPMLLRACFFTRSCIAVFQDKLMPHRVKCFVKAKQRWWNTWVSADWVTGSACQLVVGIERNAQYTVLLGCYGARNPPSRLAMLISTPTNNLTSRWPVCGIKVILIVVTGITFFWWASFKVLAYWTT